MFLLILHPPNTVRVRFQPDYLIVILDKYIPQVAATHLIVHLAREEEIINIHRREQTGDQLDSPKNVDKLRAFVLNHFMDEITPSHKALLYIKKEVGEMY